MNAPEPTKSGRRIPLLRWLRKGRVLVLLAFSLLLFAVLATKGAQRFSVVLETAKKLVRMENAMLDLRFQWRGAEPPHPNVSIVAITKPIIGVNDVTSEDLAASDGLRGMTEKEFPWRRQVWAETLDKLFAAGAAAVVFDIVFASGNVDDPAFAAAIARHPGKVGLAMTILDISTDPGVSNMQVFYPNASLLPGGHHGVAGCAIVHPDTADDSTVRRVDHFTSELRELGYADSTRELPSLSALAFKLFTGGEPSAGQHQLIRYQGGRQTYPYHSVHDLFDTRVYASPSFRGGEVFRDKIVFIGATYELAHDDKPTPFGVMAGVEVHAQAAANLLTGARLYEVTDASAQRITLVLILCGVVLIAWLRRAWVQATAIVGLLAAYVTSAHVAFSRFDLVIPMVPPLLGAGIAGAFGILLSFVLEQWEKAHTRKVLNRFVSKRIAAVILRNAEEFEHGRAGEKRAVTILFSDIRSFTTWSESAKPEHLVGQLNEYFERMVNHIEESEGNAQKFIGDAILAAWGDTHTNGPAEDARRAVATALKMRPTLRELNAQWHARDDRREISIGIGINHGDVIVGEVGHPERREFTVLGDGVNFAARLESATKQFHTDCLVGESVEALTREHFVFRHVDFLRVKGKTHPVNVFMPLSEKNTPPPGWLADYHAARALYTTRRFAEAGELFRKVDSQIGGGDFLCGMYVARCEEFVQQPPPADWDGSHTLADK